MPPKVTGKGTAKGAAKGAAGKGKGAAISKGGAASKGGASGKGGAVGKGAGKSAAGKGAGKGKGGAPRGTLSSLFDTLDAKRSAKQPAVNASTAKRAAQVVAGQKDKRKEQVTARRKKAKVCKSFWGYVAEKTRT